MEYDDEVHEKPMNHIDDEYKNAGMFDPKVAITTSRDPSSRLKQFAQEIRLIFPNAIRLNRGAHTINDVRIALGSHSTTNGNADALFCMISWSRVLAQTTTQIC